MKKEMNLFESEEKMAKNFIKVVLSKNESLREKINSFSDKDEFLKDLTQEISWRYAIDSDISDVEWFIDLSVNVYIKNNK